MEIVTISGRVLDCNNPHPDDILASDIAHHLEQTMRWRGATSRPLTVAEHSLYVAMVVSRENMLVALLHDASEAYLADLPSPVKRHCASYRSIEAVVLGAILEKFNLPPTLPEEVLEADFRMACTEKVRLLPKNVQDHPKWKHMEGVPIYEGIDFDNSIFDKPGVYLETLEMLRC